MPTWDQIANQTPEPSIYNARDRLLQYQKEWVELYQSGQATGVPIDDSQLANAAMQSIFTPKEWKQHQETQNQNVRDSVQQFWDTHGNDAKQKWLSESRNASIQLSREDTLAALRDPEPRRTAKRRTFEIAMKPSNLRNAFQNVWTDLQKWDQLPQNTNLEKFQACFMTPERVGVIVCSTLVMVAIIAFIVIFTM